MTLFSYIDRGGPIMYILLIANIVSFATIFWKFYLIAQEKKNVAANAKALFDRIKKEAGSAPSLEYTKERIGQYVRLMEKGMDLIKITATTSPLLGLLGTVLGILASFQAISAQGLGDPEVFAGGIAMALITTAGGLIVAIPNSVCYNILIGKINKIEDEIQEVIVPQINTRNTSV